MFTLTFMIIFPFDTENFTEKIILCNFANNILNFRAKRLKIKMSRTQQKITFLHELSENAFDISFQAGNMCLNTFCIDEEAGFELSGVYGLRIYELGKDSKFSSNSFSRRHRESW